jgi:hypothetical protein
VTRALALLLLPALAAADELPRCDDLDSAEVAGPCRDDSSWQRSRAPAPAPAMKRWDGPELPTQLIGSVAAGVGYRALYGYDFASGVVDLRFGGVLRRKVEVQLNLIVESGAPTVRLPVSSLLAGIAVSGVMRGSWRLGAALRVGGRFFNRITTGALADGAVWRVAVFSSGDLTKQRRATLFLAGEVAIDVTGFTFSGNVDASASAAVTLLLGARF